MKRGGSFGDCEEGLETEGLTHGSGEWGKEPCVSQDISRLNNSLGSYRRDRDPTSRARYCFPTT